LSLAVSIIHAQNQALDDFLRAQKENVAQLRQFTWTSRTALKLKGETKKVRIESVRYDGNGQLQKITIESEEPEQRDENGKVRKKVVEKKTDEYKQLLQGLGSLAQSYAHLTQAQIQSLAIGASITSGQGDMEGTMRVHATGVVVPQDDVTLWVDNASSLPREVRIQSRYDKEPVQLSVEFARLQEGPNYPAHVQLMYEAKEMQVDVRNSNYQRLVQTTSAAPATPAPDQPWPRRSSRDGATLISYQPQVDDWKDFKTIQWRMAFSLTPKGGKPLIAAASFEAMTDINSETHLVTIHDLKVLRTDFPSLDADTKTHMDELLRSFLPPTVEISLERVVACTPKQQSLQTVEVKNDPPPILVRYKPAVLLDTEGDPVNVPVPKTNLRYVLNTRWYVFLDKATSHYYFLAGDQWLTAGSLKGPWSVTAELPKEMDAIVADDKFAELRLYVPAPPLNPGAIIPEVIYTNSPADVILFNGQPAYTPIPGTDLAYANNTTSYVFTHVKDKRVFYLTSGRWFSAATLDGPWTFATPNLPDDFRKIPVSSPAAQVLASVPGTEEAKDAVLIAEIPTTAVVDRKAAEAEVKVSYDGEPKFAPIEGTSMQYATNTTQKVIQFDALYYLCFQGVWFTSTAPQGPWQTASSVPKEIYTIPPSSPIYNVTYVTQTVTPSGDVEASYTAGYLGAFVVGVGVGAVIAGGTGYYYPPYIGYYPGFYGYPAYYARPYAYGAAAYYNPATGRYGASQTVYGPYGAANRTASYNPYTGTATRTASVATPYGTASAGRAYNPYTGAAGATRQGSNAYSQWGSSVISKNGQSAVTQHYSDSRGTVGSIQGSRGGAAVGVAGAGGNNAAVGRTAGGDLYAGRDGNVYKNTGSGWQKYDNGSWNSVNSGSRSPQQSAPQRSQMQSLQSEQMNRSRGAASSQQFQRSFGGGRRR
jgi:hypothetical protein